MSIKCAHNSRVFSEVRLQFGSFWIVRMRATSFIDRLSNIFHSNLLQIIIVFCPNAQTQINFPIKQLGLGILFSAAATVAAAAAAAIRRTTERMNQRTHSHLSHCLHYTARFGNKILFISHSLSSRASNQHWFIHYGCDACISCTHFSCCLTVAAAASAITALTRNYTTRYSVCSLSLKLFSFAIFRFVAGFGGDLVACCQQFYCVI